MLSSLFLHSKDFIPQYQIAYRVVRYSSAFSGHRKFQGNKLKLFEYRFDRRSQKNFVSCRVWLFLSMLNVGHSVTVMTPMVKRMRSERLSLISSNGLQKTFFRNFRRAFPLCHGNHV